MRVCKLAMSMLDDACDQIGKRFLSDRLPPRPARARALLDEGGHVRTHGGAAARRQASGAHYHDAAPRRFGPTPSAASPDRTSPAS